MGNTFTDGTPATGSDTYGSIAGVQRYLTMLTLSDNSRPSLTDAVETEKTQYRIINAQLTNAGYTTPITDSGAVELLADAEDLMTAAALIERMIMSSDPTATKVATAEVWRSQAVNLLAPILAGKGQINTARSGVLAAVENAKDLFTDDSLEEFADAFGGLDNI